MTRPATPTRRTLIAIATVIGSTAAAVLAAYILAVGPAPATRTSIEATVPQVFGLEALTVAALAPATAVVAGASLAILLEAALQLSEARETRLELEGTSLEE
ncbi:hypothetical protein GS429_07065 [Natronorubrum sp. JWXQ-INN-674]|uniref:Uncharacterized protein n=1 Tax=Natronorubrum halalkaliphilum TaxID=2691917 RepID=A0A6B0VMP0_9EURY|nr:hypothetical protein [Natronorubrum halalkaliphilum]MXV61829.1 hypothetical protein [Natronorubrum halalkaliphilum]